jgi:hypothetical protein
VPQTARYPPPIDARRAADYLAGSIDLPHRGRLAHVPLVAMTESLWECSVFHRRGTEDRHCIHGTPLGLRDPLDTTTRTTPGLAPPLPSQKLGFRFRLSFISASSSGRGISHDSYIGSDRSRRTEWQGQTCALFRHGSLSDRRRPEVILQPHFMPSSFTCAVGPPPA